MIQDKYVTPLPTVSLNISDTLQSDLRFRNCACSCFPCSTRSKIFYKLNDVPSDKNLLFLWNKLLSREEHSAGIYCISNGPVKLDVLGDEPLITINKFMDGLRRVRPDGITYRQPVLIVATKTDVTREEAETDNRLSVRYLCPQLMEKIAATAAIEAKQSSPLLTDNSYLTDFEILKALGVVDANGAVSHGYRLMVMQESILGPGEYAFSLPNNESNNDNNPNNENDRQLEKISEENTGNTDGLKTEDKTKQIKDNQSIKNSGDEPDKNYCTRLVSLLRVSSKTGYNMGAIIPILYAMLVKEGIISEKMGKKILIPYDV